MLHFIRERAQGWIAWFIVALISIPFALWGVNSYLGGPTDTVVAKIGDQEITQVEYQRAIQMQRDRMRTMMGDKFNPAMFDNIEMKRSVLEGLIDQKLLAETSLELGQVVSDRQLVQIIQNTPAFMKEGQFDADYYKSLLTRAGLSSAKYEYDLRNDMLNQEFVSSIQNSTIVTDTSVDTVIKLEKQSREIAYGVVAAQDQLAEVKIEPEAIKAAFDQNKELYTAPEQISIEYIELSTEELKSEIEVDDTELKQFYADHQDQFVGPEQRRVSHILIEGDDEDTRAMLVDLKEQLAGGASFSDLAKQYSQDTGSSENGGDLGFIQQGVMGDEFETAVFNLATEGDVSEPVQTEFGYHLIKLTQLEAPQGKSFAQAKAEVSQLYKQSEAEKLFYEKAEQLADLSYEDPDSLQPTADALDLEVKQSQFFTRNGGSGIASEDKVVNAAFSNDVLEEGLNSTVIELSKNHFVVLRKHNYKEESLLPFDSVAPAIEEGLRFEQARIKAQQIGEGYLLKIEDGEKPETLLLENWHQAAFYERNSDAVSQQILQHAFAMKKPEQTNPSYSGFIANNGNYIVVQLTSIKDASAASLDKEQREALREQLKRIAIESELSALLASIKEDAEIEIFDQHL
jgi:peptidyl-prolyl cis-trans isomerase D